MNHSYSAHLCEEPTALIACENQTHTGGMLTYPVLLLGDAAFFPTREQLRRIGAAVLGWLAANPDRPTVNMGPTCDLCGSAVDGENYGQSTADTVLCRECVSKAQRQHVQDQRTRFVQGQRANVTIIDEYTLPPDLCELPLSQAPDGATYTIGTQYWVRKDGQWVNDLPF